MEPVPGDLRLTSRLDLANSKDEVFDAGVSQNLFLENYRDQILASDDDELSRSERRRTKDDGLARRPNKLGRGVFKVASSKLMTSGSSVGIAESERSASEIAAMTVTPLSVRA